MFGTTEPNLLSGTAHSVNKRGVKRRDLDVEELKEILSPLLPYVRMEHILPPSSEVLSDAVSVLRVGDSPERPGQESYAPAQWLEPDVNTREIPVAKRPPCHPPLALTQTYSSAAVSRM